MIESQKCSRCGAELPPDAPGGHCLKCLLQLGLTSEENSAEEAAEVSDTTNSARSERPALPLAEKPGDRIGHYKLLEQIGEGGCGVVYMAEQEEPVRRRVALKVIKLGMDTRSVIARFEAERQALAMMDHPNIAKVLDGGASPTGRPYFVMELVRGVKITSYCDEQKLSTRQRLDLFISVCQAVQHAHQKGIIHRDLKPSNILVTEQDGASMPKIIDFGIAKATTDQRLTDKTLFTAFEQFIGTPAYMSPEQAGLGGLDIDTRSDIYSLGVLLYELLTGQQPFDSEQFVRSALDEILRTIREKEPPRPSARLTTLTEQELTTVAQRRQIDSTKLPNLLRGDLDWIVMKALEKDRTRRYDTANGFARDLQRFLDNEAVVARPPSNLYRFQKLVRRNKLAFAAVGAVTIALLLGLGMSTWLFLKERQARQRVASEAAKSQQVAQFLKNMLSGVGPSVAKGRDTKMLREILDKTAERVGRELGKQPGVEAELRNTIGEVYGNLGDSRKAEEMFRAALAMRTKLFGSEHPEVATSLDNLAVVLMYQDKFAEAETLHRQALSMRRKLLGSNDTTVAESLTGLGTVLWHQGKLSEAEATHRQALALRRKILGDKHPDLAVSLNNLGVVLTAERKLAEAEVILREALALRRKILSSDDLDLTFSLANLSSALWGRGNLAEAESLQREGITIMRKVIGPEHPTLALSINNLGTILWEQEKQAEAEVVFREALAMQQKLLGPEHNELAVSLNNLAVALWNQGKLAQAETMNREALAMRRRLLGDEHGDVAWSLNSLAFILRDLHNLPEAETAAREALRIRRKIFNQEDTILAISMDNLAVMLRDQGKFAEAEVFTRECLVIREKKVPEEWITFNARSRLGADLLGQKKYAEAETLLLSGYEGMRQREEKIPRDKKVRLKEALERIVQFYEETGRSDQATEWKQKLIEFNKGGVEKK